MTNDQNASSKFTTERLTGFGGSDAHKYMSAGNYGCVRAVTYEKAGVPPDYPFTGNNSTQRGIFLEDKSGQLYGQRSGRKVWRRAEMLRHKEDPWLICHIDRMITASDGNVDQDGLALPGTGVLEIKTMNERSYRRFLDIGLPIGYQLQLQHAMLVTGWQWGSFAVYWPDGHEMRLWDVRRDPAKIAEMRDKAKWAWERTLATRQLIQIGGDLNDALPERLPANDVKCQKCQWRSGCQGAAIMERFGDGFEQGERYDESLTPLVNEHKSIKAALIPLQIKLKEIERDLRAKMDDRLAAECSAGQVTYRPQKKGRAIFRVLRVA